MQDFNGKFPHDLMKYHRKLSESRHKVQRRSTIGEMMDMGYLLPQGVFNPKLDPKIQANELALLRLQPKPVTAKVNQDDEEILSRIYGQRFGTRPLANLPYFLHNFLLRAPRNNS